MFDFQSDSINEKKFKSTIEINPLLFSNSDKPQFYILVEESLPVDIISKLNNFIKAEFGNLQYSIISILNFKPSEKDKSKQIIDLYGENCINLNTFIPEWSKVITIGRALYGVTKSDDLTIEGFYDLLLYNTSFFSPELKSQIFPLPFLFSWLGKTSFENFFAKKQFNQLIKLDLKKIRIPQPTLEFINEPNTFLLEKKSYEGIVSFDLETKGLDPWSPKGKIICLTLAFHSELHQRKAYYLPFEKIDVEILNNFFRNKKLVGNNIKYDIKWLVVKAGVQRSNLNLYWDNMKSSQTINELQNNSLKTDAWLYTPYGGYDRELDLYLKKYPKCKEDYSLIPQNILSSYATMDALVSLICYVEHQIVIDTLDKKCVNETGWSIRDSLEKISMPAINMFCDIEISGMNYDWDKLRKLSIELDNKIAEKRKEIYNVMNIPETIDIDSGTQLGKYLESIQWENPGRSKDGYYLTNEESMHYWEKKGHIKEVKLLNEYTDLNTTMNTFVGRESDNSGYWKYRKPDNKIHPSFAVMMADSGRGKCYDPNLQQVTKHGEWAEKVRACFSIPSKDFYISENDAAGLQLRIGATMSGDEMMRNIFTKYGGDMHSITAQSILKNDISLEEFLKRKKEPELKEIRFSAKSINFGFEFGQVPFSFVKTLQSEWTIQKAKDYVYKNGLISRQQKIYKDFINKELDNEIKTSKEDILEFSYYLASSEDIRKKFFITYKGLEEWHVSQHAFAKKNGYVQSYWGPIRRLPYLICEDVDKKRQKNYENISLNSPVQNFEACYMMYNMVRLHNALKELKLKSYLVGNVHDSFIMYLHKDEMQIVKTLINKYFHEPIPSIMKGIPYLIETGFSDYANGEIWGITEHEF